METEPLRNYMPAERLEKIADIINKTGSARVTDLSLLFDVAEITVRRDLDRLEEEGRIERTHGGAISLLRLKTEPHYAQKRSAHREEKEFIGRVAAGLIKEGETLLVNSGSTTLEVLRHLETPGVRVITSNAGALQLPPREGLELLLTGGDYRRQSNSLVGPFAESSLQKIIGSTAIIGVDGLSCRYGLTTPNQYEAAIARLMIERTRGRVIVVADHWKIGVVANFVSAPVEAVDLLVCDAGLDREYISELEEKGIRLIRA